MSRKLDAAIAEALGFNVEKSEKQVQVYSDSTKLKQVDIYKVERFEAGGYNWFDLPDYSTDGNAMLELDREMRERGFDYRISTVTGWRGLKESKEIEVVFYKNSNEMATGWRSKKEMSLIFARQAYWALTGKEWQGE